MARLHDYYKETVTGQLQEQFKYNNAHQTPQVTKIILNIGIGDARENPKKLEALRKDLSNIAGQHAVATKARVSVANFKIREGMPIGSKVTLRGPRMFHFMQKLVSSALPRVRDFQGLSRKAFDGQGNYNLGVREQLIFPEVDYDQMEKVRGMNITFVTSTSKNEDALALLEELGLPFVRTRSK